MVDHITELSFKQEQFNQAMVRYNERPGYRLFSALISLLNVGLQGLLLFQLFQLSISPLWLLMFIPVALYLADLINGFVHLFMDHQDGYDSLAGPLVASFHLHHQTPLYKKRPLIMVYVVESGVKVWLVVYLLLVQFFLLLDLLPAALIYLLILIGILSSVAEVSHYLCHSSRSPLFRGLARAGLLLSARHHAPHHARDNTNYAFLNGWSDPVLNLVARRFYTGYKQTTDLHYAHYVPPEGER